MNTNTSIAALLIHEPVDQRKPTPKPPAERSPEREPRLQRKPEPTRKVQRKARSDPEPDQDPPQKKRAARRKPGPIELDQLLLLKEQVLKLCGEIGYSTLWGYMKSAGFPHPIAIGKVDGRSTKSAWIASEVYAWIAARPRRPIGDLKEIREEQVAAAQRRRRDWKRRGE